MTDVNHLLDLEKALHQGPGTNRDVGFDAITLNRLKAHTFSPETDGSPAL